MDRNDPALGKFNFLESLPRWFVPIWWRIFVHSECSVTSRVKHDLMQSINDLHFGVIKLSSSAYFECEKFIPEKKPSSPTNPPHTTTHEYIGAYFIKMSPSRISNQKTKNTYLLKLNFREGQLPLWPILLSLFAL